MTRIDRYHAFHSKIRKSITGFILSLFLTGIPFWIVIKELFSQNFRIGIVFSTALLQIVVHLLCFLNINLKDNEGWNFISLIFTIVIIAILSIGSIWIMYNLNHNIMI